MMVNVAFAESPTMITYLYSLANASLALRVVEFLHDRHDLPLESMTVIHQIDGWVVSIRFRYLLEPHIHSNFQAFMRELGIPYEPTVRVQMALWSLETGQSPVEVMRHYQIVVVSHGSPDSAEIEAFRGQFVQGLGYCPETLA
jgi:hypothetical protein